MFEEYGKGNKLQDSEHSQRASHKDGHTIHQLSVESLVTTPAQIISSNAAVTSKGTSAILGRHHWKCTSLWDLLWP